MTKSTNAVKPSAAFKWNDETYLAAAQMYAEALGASFDGKAIVGDIDPAKHADANSEPSLANIAAAIGAKSARAIRGKLAKEGVYIVAEQAATVSKSTRLSRGQYVRSLAKGLGLDVETLQTLDKSNLEALEVLTARVSDLLVSTGGKPIEVK